MRWRDVLSKRIEVGYDGDSPPDTSSAEAFISWLKGPMESRLYVRNVYHGVPEIDPCHDGRMTFACVVGDRIGAIAPSAVNNEKVFEVLGLGYVGGSRRLDELADRIAPLLDKNPTGMGWFIGAVFGNQQMGNVLTNEIAKWTDLNSERKAMLVDLVCRKNATVRLDSGLELGGLGTGIAYCHDHAYHLLCQRAAAQGREVWLVEPILDEKGRITGTAPISRIPDAAIKGVDIHAHQGQNDIMASRLARDLDDKIDKTKLN